MDENQSIQVLESKVGMVEYKNNVFYYRYKIYSTYHDKNNIF